MTAATAGGGCGFLDQSGIWNLKSSNLFIYDRRRKDEIKYHYIEC